MIAQIYLPKGFKTLNAMFFFIVALQPILPVWVQCGESLQESGPTVLVQIHRAKQTGDMIKC